jgi:hypothetical protein
MDYKTATISKKKFASYILLGLFERVVGEHGIDEENNNLMKKLRQGQGSCGKSRRRRRLF